MSKKGNKIEYGIWSGEMLGIRIGKHNARRYFKKENSEIYIEVDTVECRTLLNPTFWSTCPEIRVARDKSGKNILSKWIEKNNLLPPKTAIKKRGKKDKVILEVIEPYRRFAVHLK